MTKEKERALRRPLAKRTVYFADEVAERLGLAETTVRKMSNQPDHWLHGARMPGCGRVLFWKAVVDREAAALPDAVLPFARPAAVRREA